MTLIVQNGLAQDQLTARGEGDVHHVLTYTHVHTLCRNTERSCDGQMGAYPHRVMVCSEIRYW